MEKKREKNRKEEERGIFADTTIYKWKCVGNLYDSPQECKKSDEKIDFSKRKKKEKIAFGMKMNGNAIEN